MLIFKSRFVPSMGAWALASMREHTFKN